MPAIRLLGWRAVSLDWGSSTSGDDYQRSLEYIRRRVVPGRTVVVGISYGGSYAAHLSSTGEVRGALAIAPPSHLTNRQVEQAIGHAVPDVPPAAFARSRRSSPLFIIHDPRDPYAAYASSTHLARTQPKVRVMAVEGVEPHTPVLSEWAHVGIRLLARHSRFPDRPSD